MVGFSPKRQRMNAKGWILGNALNLITQIIQRD